MTKNHKLLLQDYLKDSTDLRLSLFATMLNSLFKLDKKNKEQLVRLIDDYKLDQSKMRLDMIEKFIGGASQEKGLFKPKQAKEVKASPVQTAELKELSDNEKQMNNLRSALSALLRTPNWATNISVKNQIDDLRAQLQPLEMKAGFYDPAPPEKSKLDIIFGLFGHWDDPESLAYEMFHGNRPRLEVRTNQDVPQAIRDLIVLSGKQMRQFYVTSNEMSGGVKGTNHRPIWTLVDAASGQGPANSNFIETNLQTGQTTNMDKASGGFAQVGGVNLNGAGWNKK